MKAKYEGRCPICKLRIMKGDDVSHGRWKVDVPEQHNYVTHYTRDAHTRIAKWAHSDCKETMEVKNEVVS